MTKWNVCATTQFWGVFYGTQWWALTGRCKNLLLEAPQHQIVVLPFSFRHSLLGSSPYTTSVRRSEFRSGKKMCFPRIVLKQPWTDEMSYWTPLSTPIKRVTELGTHLAVNRSENFCFIANESAKCSFKSMASCAAYNGSLRGYLINKS